MRTLPPLLLADLQADSTSLAFLWTIEMADGRMIRGTEHDQDIVLPEMGSPDKYGGHYFAVANITLGDISSNTDISVDNLDVVGAFADLDGSPLQATVIDVNLADVESGNLDRAPVTILICNWRDPSHGYFVVKSGSLGAISYDSDFKYTTEVRGLTQSLAQTIIRTFSATCNVVRFGDNRCKYPVASIQTTGVVETGTNNNRRSFVVHIDGVGSDASPPATVYPFTGGTLTFTSGANKGFSREIKLDPVQNSGIVLFWDQFPNAVNAGDTFDISPGCDRQPTTCKHVYNNFLNWRGYGLFIPGVNAITAGPVQGAEL